jgi:hypothetical protein
MRYSAPTKSDKIGYWVFVVFMSFIMLWVILIHPLTEPAKDMPFIFAYNTKTHQVYPHQQNLEYAELTGGAIFVGLLLAAVMIIPTEREMKFREKLYDAVDKNRITHDDYMTMSDKTTTKNVPEMRQKLATLIDGYRGRDLFKEQYGGK